MATTRLFNVPDGEVASVRIIDTTTVLKYLPARYFMTPPIHGLEHMPDAPTWSFLVESKTGKKALFDLGVPPNWRTFAPSVVNRLATTGWGISASKHVEEILRDNQVDPASISSIIWSHSHWDHLGDPSTFPPGTEVIFGPGFKEAFLPGWPAREDSPVRETDFKGRNVREISFEGPDVLTIGKFPAIDLFGDGSFYLLDTPGHAVGHLAGLARTTPDTFIFMGGDLCHHGGELRPSEHLPLPEKAFLQAFSHFPGGFCPGAELEALQTSRSRAVNEPFLDPNMGVDIPQAISTIRKAQEADGDPNVLFIYAHDASVGAAVDLFPKYANDWKEKGWRENLLWQFLGDFESALTQAQKL